MKSILQTEKFCYICSTTNWLESHHCFGGTNRKVSERYGLKVWLCKKHHMEAHEGGKLTEHLHRVGQQEFEKTRPKTEFMQVFGKNYL